MNTTPARRAADRSRAVRRLRSLTLGTAVAGVAATGAFGWLAAATYHGTWTAADAGTTTAAAADSTTTTDTSSTTDNSTAITSSTPVTNSTGTAHVSTGGS